MNAAIEYYIELLSNFKRTIPEIMSVLLIILGLIGVFAIVYRRYLLKRCFIKEYWLPIVDDAENVIGRVARSVSLETPGRYQHPLIRILVFKSGCIYLSPRVCDFSTEIGKYDYPIECMMKYGKSIEDTLSYLQDEYFPKSQQPKFILKYKHENEIGRWQVLLYFLPIDDEAELVGVDKAQGKFWTIQQIRENVGKSCFSSFLEGELDFLQTLNEFS